MGGKEQPQQKIVSLVEVTAKVGIFYHDGLRLDFMLPSDVFDPATDTVCVAGPAHHIEYRCFINWIIQRFFGPEKVI